MQQIFRGEFAAFAATRKLPAYMTRAAERIMACRTAALGGHVQSCPNGHVHRVHYNSCKHRSCPQCAFLQVERWLARQRERLLACEHFHIIFTVPSELNPYWRYNKRLFASLLFRAVHDTLAELLGDPRYLGATAAILAALHTWGQTLSIHPHVHVLVTAGGLTGDGQWQVAKKSCLLPRRVLMEVFRGKLRAALLNAAEAGELVLPPDRTLAQFCSLMNKLGRVPWNVKILERYGHGRGVATYLARYLRGGPIGNSRLVDYRDGRVTIRYRDNRELDASSGRGRSKTTPLPVHDFLARVLEHVPPPRLQMVRSWGLYASSRREALSRARAALGQPALEPAAPRVSWQDALRRLGADAATRCRVCGAELVTWGHFRPGEPPPPLPATTTTTGTTTTRTTLSTNLHSSGLPSTRPPPSATRSPPVPCPRGPSNHRLKRKTCSVSGCS